VLVGAVLLVVLIWWIEERIDRRRKAQLADGYVPGPASNPLDALPAFADLTAPAHAPAPPPPMIPGPLGALPAAQGSEQIMNRSITAATGSGGLPPQATPGLVDVPRPETPALDRDARPFAPKPPTAAEGAAPHVPEGPRLHLRIENPTSMIATLDDESEPISLKELRAAADALARADGSATITSAPTIEARARAQELREILSKAGVPTTVDD
jgi:hypothetical protein